MTVTYRDELGVLALKIDDTYGVTFDGCKAYFMDEDGKCYIVAIEHLISIIKEN